MSELVCLSRRARMGNSLQVRLLDLASWSLLKHQDLAIASLETLPSELFPQLFLDAFQLKCTETLRAMGQVWPFPTLPLGRLLQEILPCMKSLEAVMEGIDVLLGQEVRSRRCKLQVLDFSPIGDQFWYQWCGTPVRWSSKGKAPRPVESARKGHTFAHLEIVVDLTVSIAPLPKLTAYIFNWVKERKDVHLCCRKITFLHNSFIDMCLNTVKLSCVQEVEANLYWKTSTLELFAPILDQTKNLQRLIILCTEVPRHIWPSMLKGESWFVTLLSTQFLQLHSLRELYLESATFLKGHLDQVLRCLRIPLETLSLTECPLLEQDLTSLGQCPNLTQLKELSLRGTPLSRVRDHLCLLLENCASTLQDLDLGMCGLQDSHLEAILPALILCSQLRILKLFGNRVSKAVLVQMLRHLAGLPRLTLEVYPAPQESYSAPKRLHQKTFDLLCARLRAVLRDLGKPRLIMIPNPALSSLDHLLEKDIWAENSALANSFITQTSEVTLHGHGAGNHCDILEHVQMTSLSLTPHLQTLSISHCLLLERDSTHLCQCPNLIQLRELSLRGTDPDLVGESLPILLESCASTLQDLDLGVGKLLDIHAEAILPVLKLCSSSGS